MKTWTADVVARLGVIVVGLGEKISDLSEEALEAALPYLKKGGKAVKDAAKLLADKLRPVADAVKDWTKEKLEEFGEVLPIVLDDIAKISSDVFANSIESLQAFHEWSKPQLEMLAAKAVEALDLLQRGRSSNSKGWKISRGATLGRGCAVCGRKIRVCT